MPNILINKLKFEIRGQKTLVLIDGANLFFTSSSKHLNIDFPSLIQFFQKNTSLINCSFYTAFNPEDEKQLTFLEYLKSLGYNLNTKPIKTFSECSKKGNLDVEISVDAVLQNSEYKILVLVSGDGDFTYLLEKIRNLNKKVIVLGVGGFVAHSLPEVADSFYFLERIPKLWKKPYRKKLTTSEVIPQILDLDKLVLEKKQTKNPNQTKTKKNSNLKIKSIQQKNQSSLGLVTKKNKNQGKQVKN